MAAKTSRSKHRARRNGRLRPKDEAFCQAIVSGVSGTQAYRDHMAVGPVATTTAQTGGYLLLRNSYISNRIKELREADKRSVEEKLGFGREQATRYLVEAVTTPIGEIDQNHPLCQEMTTTMTEGSTTVKLKSVSKLDAMEKLAKMAGWYPSTGQGAQQAGPQVVINLGGMFSPALGEGDSLKAIRTVEAQAVRIPATQD